MGDGIVIVPRYHIYLQSVGQGKKYEPKHIYLIQKHLIMLSEKVSLYAMGLFIFSTHSINIHSSPRTWVFISRSVGRPGSSEVHRHPLTRWDVSSIPANGIFLTKKLKNENKNAQRVEND